MQFCSYKLDFLRFDGENLIGWIYKVNQYFALNPIPDRQKNHNIFLPHGGDALIWF